MPHSHRVLCLHPLAIFKYRTQVRVILDMDAYEAALVWDYSTVLNTTAHHHVGQAYWDGILHGLNSMCPQLSSWQVRIDWYPISWKCRQMWALLSWS